MKFYLQATTKGKKVAKQLINLTIKPSKARKGEHKCTVEEEKAEEKEIDVCSTMDVCYDVAKSGGPS